MAVAPALESHRRQGGPLSQDQFRRELTMAAELVASGHGDALVRCGVAWMAARTVVELLGPEIDHPTRVEAFELLP